MLPITEKKLKTLISEAKEAGRDHNKLDEALKKIKSLNAKKPHFKEKKSGDFVYCSTGPSREDDFE